MFEQVTLILGTGITIFVAVNAFFFKADDFFSKEFKDDVALWILCVEPCNQDSQGSPWSRYFIQLFDRIFSKPLSHPKPSNRWREYVNFRTFFYSCIASLIAITVIMFIGFTIGPLSHDNFPEGREWGGFIVFALIFGTMFNLVPDYFSLLQTRYFLKIIEHQKSFTKLVLFLVADIIFTFIIFLFFATQVLVMFLDGFEGLENPFLYTLEKTLSNWRGVFWLDAKGTQKMFGVFFYSTFFTSVWIWLFGISNIILSTARRSGPTIKFLKYMLPVEERPFRSIGIVAGLVAMIIYFVFAVINTTVEQVV